MKSRNGGAYPPRRKSGTSHHRVASTTRQPHTTRSTARRRQARPVGERQHHRGQQQARQHQRGVLATHEGDGGRRPQQREPSPLPAAQVEHQRQDGPREHHRRQRLAAESADRRQDARREHVRQTSEHGADRADPRPVRGQAPGSRVGQQHQGGRPQPFPHPHRHVEGVAQQERRAHREQVAGRLVLQPADGRVTVPQAQAPGQEPPGIELQVELGVEGDQPGLLHQVERQRECHHDERDQGVG